MQLIKHYFLLYFAIAFLLGSCFRGPERGRTVLASVDNVYLYEDEVEGMLPSGLSENDSLEYLKLYVDSWINQQIIIQDANKILSAREKDFNVKIRDYRNALLTFEWEKKVLREKMDTIVTNEQQLQYYEENLGEFVLQADIVRVLYIKLNANSTFRSEAIGYITSVPFQKESTEQFCRKYAVNYFLDIKAWLFVDDLLKEIPLQQQQKQEMLTGNAFIEMKDEEYIYLLKVADAKNKGSVSPFALESTTIKEIILQKRKAEILNNYITSLKQKAEQNSRITYNIQ